MELCLGYDVGCRVRFADDFARSAASRGGEPLCVALPGKICAGKALPGKPLPSERRRTNPRPASATFQRTQSSNSQEGTPVPDSKDEQPPVIRRAEVVAFALVSLLIICVVAVLYARESVLSSDHDGVHRRHHAVAGGKLSRAPPDSPRAWRPS